MRLERKEVWQMDRILHDLPEVMKAKLKERNQPGWMQPMLATLTDERFSDKGWIFERKFDGERCLAYRDGDPIRLLSRNQKELNVHYPELVEDLKQKLGKHIILDGEIVAFDGNVTSFSRLQKRMHIQNPQEARESEVKVYYYLFDILYLEGYDLTQIPLRTRKSILKKVLDYQDPVRYTLHRNQEGEAYFQKACETGWEGIIAKDASSAYLHGRSKKWLKFKCVKEQEFVIGGYTEPQGERIGFGALLIGYYQDGELCYAGKVGTGYSDETLHDLQEKMSKLGRNETPFAPDPDLPEKEVHWIEAKLVVQVGFEEWTEKNRLRQPRFLGLREDKESQSVRKEEP
jgi:DNA ligase D-like protein (predicted ligase)